MPADGLAPDDQKLGVRVSGTLPGESKPRTVAGSVAMWHKGGKSPWANPTAWPRQLRYMGAREWCRAHKPSLMLGILTDDEVDEYEVGRAAGAIPPSGPQLLHADFEDRPRAIEAPKPTPRKRREQAAAGAAEGAQGAETQAPAAQDPPATTAAVDVLEGDDISDTVKGRPTETASAQAAESAPASSGSATDASGASAAEPSSPPQAAEPSQPSAPETAAEDPEDVIKEGYPEPDEVYHLNGDEWGEDGRRDTYKNGLPFSSSGRKPGYAIYEDHRPERAEAEQDGDEADDNMPPELKGYVVKIEGAKTWEDVKLNMREFWGSPFFKSLTPASQNQIRASTWDTVVETKPKDLPDHAMDITAFRLWIEYIEDPDAIVGTLRVLKESPSFTGAAEPTRDAIEQAAHDRTALLQNG
jgi:hypothetical protein